MIPSFLTLAKARQQIQRRELDPRDLVDRCLRQVRQYDERVSAWVLVDEQAARTEAERQSRLVSEGDGGGLLHGIPLGIKDIMDVAGLPTLAGSRLRSSRPAPRDAVLVHRLREAGAIILGKTVTTEFASFDPPPTRNPWNPCHTPGGSSSGSAAAVALGMCTAALGSQTGGSIIRPASYCGVAGFKPTFGHVSLDGVVPLSPHLDHAGPLARCVEDLTWLYIAMADPESLARSWRKLPEQIAALRSSWRSAPTQAEIGASLSPASDTTPRLVVLAEFVHLAEPEVREATSRALHRLGGAVAQEVTIPDALARVQQSHRCIMARDAAAYHRQTYKAFRDSYGPKIAALIEEGLAATKEEYAAALDHLNAFRRRMESVFSQGTLAVLPATNTTAPNRLDTTGDPIFNSIWSFAGFPAVTVPCGLAADGMPCGLQLVGPPNSDLRLLAAAMWCEREIGFDDTPPMLGEPEIQARRRG